MVKLKPPKWLELGLPVESNYTQASLKGDFIAQYRPDYFIDKKQVLSATEDANTVILDARAYARFTGAAHYMYYANQLSVHCDHD